MILAASAEADNTFEGSLYWAASPDFLTFHALDLPEGTQFQHIRPDFVTFRRYTYVVGQFSPGVVIDPFNFTCYQNGVPRPGLAPVIAAVTGDPGISASSVLGYITFAIKLPDGTFLMESNPSPVSNSITFTTKAIQWTSLPTASSNPAVNTIRGWRSVAGTVPRVAWERELGTTTVTEEVPTLALGSQLPNTEGTLDNANGVPPHTRFVEVYHDRIWYAGDQVHPERIYFSEVLKGWAVKPTSYFETRDGEFVTGLKKVRDQLIVFTRRATYSIMGWTAADFVQTKVSPNIGCISHHSIVEIDNRLWFASEDGVYTYDGSFVYQMEDLRDYWRNEYTRSDGFDWKRAYEISVGADDRFWRTYKLLVPRPAFYPDLQGFYYVGHYSFGAQAQWVFDQRARRDLVHLGHSMQYVFTGDSNGVLRLENWITNFDDANDSDVMKILIRSPLLLFDAPGGDQEEGGKTFYKITSYVESEATAWTIRVIAGDEDAYNQMTPDNIEFFWKDDLAASALTRVNVEGWNYTYCAKSVHTHIPEKVHGRGLMVEIYALFPENLKYRGFGGWYGPGPAGRKPKSKVPYDPG